MPRAALLAHRHWGNPRRSSARPADPLNSTLASGSPPVTAATATFRRPPAAEHHGPDARLGPVTVVASSWSWR